MSAIFRPHAFFWGFDNLCLEYFINDMGPLKEKKTQLVNRNETFYNRALSSLVSPYVHNVVSTVVDNHKKKPFSLNS